MMQTYNTTVEALRRSGSLVHMEKGVLEITSEASELRLPPSQWPTNVLVLAGDYLHELKHTGYDQNPDGEVQGAHYATKDKHVTMLIIND